MCLLMQVTQAVPGPEGRARARLARAGPPVARHHHLMVTEPGTDGDCHSDSDIISTVNAVPVSGGRGAPGPARLRVRAVADSVTQSPGPLALSHRRRPTVTVTAGARPSATVTRRRVRWHSVRLSGTVQVQVSHCTSIISATAARAAVAPSHWQCQARGGDRDLDSIHYQWHSRRELGRSGDGRLAGLS